MAFLDNLVIDKILDFINPDYHSMMPFLRVVGLDHCQWDYLDIYHSYYNTMYCMKTRTVVNQTTQILSKTFNVAVSGPGWRFLHHQDGQDNKFTLIPSGSVKSLFKNVWCFNEPGYFVNVSSKVIVFAVIPNYIYVAVSLYKIPLFWRLWDSDYFERYYSCKKSSVKNEMFDSEGHYNFLVLDKYSHVPDPNKYYIMSTTMDSI